MNQKVKKIAIESVIITLILIGLVWVLSHFIHLGRVEFTDNAQVRQQIVPVNSRVQGFIRKIYYKEYQKVRKGDTLLVIEDTEFRLRLAQAEADYQRALVGKTTLGTGISAATNNIAVSESGIEEVRVMMENARKDFERYQNLLSREAVTVQQFEAMKTSYEALKAKYEMLVRQKKTTSLGKVERAQNMQQQDASIAVAKAMVDLARLNLSYTVITAPCNGTLGRKAIQEGQLIQMGQSLVSVVDTDDCWILANFKESQMNHIAEGMKVEIAVDALSGLTIQGRVSAISGATGAQFSLVPQDNAAGNFVKVEQLIPVKISLDNSGSSDSMEKLRAGMSVECKVKY